MSRIAWLLAASLLAFAASIGTVVLNAGGNADAVTPASCSTTSSPTRAARAPIVSTPPKCVVQFGLAGEPWDPAGPSGGGITRDRNEPSLLLITAGTTVEFKNAGNPHRISIYNHGIGGVTNFADVTGEVVANVIQANATPGETLVGPLAAGASTSYQFTEPGQYLVICAFDPHFRNLGQSTFIVVNESIN